MDDAPLMTSREVADLFRVDIKTVTRWSDAGKIKAIRTLGGHRRFVRSEILSLILREGETSEHD